MENFYNEFLKNNKLKLSNDRFTSILGMVDGLKKVKNSKQTGIYLKTTIIRI